MSVAVRAGAAADLPSVLASEVDGFLDDAWSESLVSDGLAGGVPTIRYWVAEDGGRIVGHAVVSVAAEDAELQRIATALDVRRRGVGRRLLDACVADAAERGAERIVLEVREDNVPGLALYAAAGFTELARRPRYYRDGTTAVVLSRSIGTEHP